MATLASPAPRTTPAAVGLALAAAVFAVLGAWIAVGAIDAVVRLISAPPAARGLTDATWAQLAEHLPLFQAGDGSIVFTNSSVLAATHDPSYVTGPWVLSASADLLSALAMLVPIVSGIVLLTGLLLRRPFSTLLTRMTATGGIAMLVGGVAAYALQTAARSQMLDAVAPTLEANGWQVPSAVLPPDPALLVGGSALLVVALAFQVGARFQRDTEGLV